MIILPLAIGAMTLTTPLKLGENLYQETIRFPYTTSQACYPKNPTNPNEFKFSSWNLRGYFSVNVRYRNNKNANEAFTILSISQTIESGEYVNGTYEGEIDRDWEEYILPRREVLVDGKEAETMRYPNELEKFKFHITTTPSAMGVSWNWQHMEIQEPSIYYDLFDGKNKIVGDQGTGFMWSQQDLDNADGWKVDYETSFATNAKLKKAIDEEIKRMISPSEYWSEGYKKGKDQGYQDGLKDGREGALNDSQNINNFFSLLTPAFQACENFFSMRIFGFLPLYWFFLIPIAGAIIALIVRLIS